MFEDVKTHLTSCKRVKRHQAPFSLIRSSLLCSIFLFPAIISHAGRYEESSSVKNIPGTSFPRIHTPFISRVTTSQTLVCMYQTAAGSKKSIAVTSTCDPTYRRGGPHIRILNVPDASGNRRGDTVPSDNSFLGSYFVVNYKGRKKGWKFSFSGPKKYTKWTSSLTRSSIDGSVFPPLLMNVSYNLANGTQHRLILPQKDVVTFFMKDKATQASITYTMNFHLPYEEPVIITKRQHFPDIPKDYKTRLNPTIWHLLGAFKRSTVTKITKPITVKHTWGFTCSKDLTLPKNDAEEKLIHNFFAAKCGLPKAESNIITENVGVTIKAPPPGEIWEYYYADAGIDYSGTAAKWGKHGFIQDGPWHARYVTKKLVVWHIVLRSKSIKKANKNMPQRSSPRRSLK